MFILADSARIQPDFANSNGGWKIAQKATLKIPGLSTRCPVFHPMSVSLPPSPNKHAVSLSDKIAPLTASDQRDRADDDSRESGPDSRRLAVRHDLAAKFD